MKDLMHRLHEEDACPGGLVNLVLAAFRLFCGQVHSRTVLQGLALGKDEEEIGVRSFNTMLNALSDAVGLAVKDRSVTQEDFLLLITGVATGIWLEYSEEGAVEGSITREGERPASPSGVLRMLADQLDETMDEEALLNYEASYHELNGIVDRDDFEAEIINLGGEGEAVAELLRRLGLDGDGQVH
jgi:hypothetical protein